MRSTRGRSLEASFVCPPPRQRARIRTHPPLAAGKGRNLARRQVWGSAVDGCIPERRLVVDLDDSSRFRGSLPVGVVKVLCTPNDPEARAPCIPNATAAMVASPDAMRPVGMAQPRRPASKEEAYVGQGGQGGWISRILIQWLSRAIYIMV
jgi:hypothetical protein